MPSPGSYLFGAYRLQFPAGLLYRGQEIAPLPPKAAQVLMVLLENSGEVVSKADLLKSAWQNAVVEEGSLTRTISVLRKVLGTDPDGTNYIATISKRGYRLTVPIRVSEKPARAAKEKVLLVVLPFENLSPDPDQEYFSEGLTEEMITQLSRLNPERLGVIARTSAMMFKGTNKRIADIGNELGVNYVLQGSVRRAGNQLRISAQLIRVDDETHVWAKNYARSLGDVLKLQSEVARSIAAEIQIKLTPRGERTLREASGVAPEAYEAYLRGRHSWNKRTEEGMRESIVHYQNAIHLCPEYALAHAGVADSNVMLACRGMVSAKETFRKAKTAARKAIELDEGLGVAHASLAHVRLHDWDWEGLEKDFRHAIELDPSQGIAYYWFGEYLMTMGRPEEAIAVTREAHRMDPLSPVIGSSMAMILYLARKYDRALATLERTRETHPEHFLPHMRMGLILTQQGDHTQAIAELTTAVALSNRSTETLAALAAGFAAAGNIEQAENLTAHLERLQGQRYVLPYNIAKIHAAAGNKEMAFHWLEKAYDEGNPDLIELNSEPVFDNLRGDSRLSDLMSRVGWIA
ncbi:MAG: winged helix-turn-helix domain-containing protein [Pseudomonadota bacterium]|nr:winged helix-turn-helix domain-containing protein [Pseudomonadota bacterium]